MADADTLTLAELEAGLEAIRQSPKPEGVLSLIVRRPRVDQREVLATGELNEIDGLVGDGWRIRGVPDPEAQITLINARLIALIAREKDRWPLAGDQLVVDMDLGVDNLPAGTRVAVGAAVIEVSAQPHTGCDKFAARFGRVAAKWVNSLVGRQLRLRGVNAKVIKPGAIRVGDIVRKL